MSKTIFGVLALPFFITGLAWSIPVNATDVNIIKGLPAVNFTHKGKSYRIQRNQNQSNKITGGFAKTSRKCPPFCIQKMAVAPGVHTAGELEVMEFLKNKVGHGSGILIDARTPAWYKKGTIPGSVNMPFTLFSRGPGDPKLDRILKILGVKSGRTVNWTNSQHHPTSMGKSVRNITLDFSDAKELMLFCNGPWCGQSPRAIKGLIQLGYPMSKIHYYRGGMQLWLLLGLNTIVPR